MVRQGTLVGIISWGGICGVHPGVYTRIASYTSGVDTEFVEKLASTERASCITHFIVIMLGWICGVR